MDVQRPLKGRHRELRRLAASRLILAASQSA